MSRETACRWFHAGVERYATQREAYALAVERLCGVDGDMVTRLVFLRDWGEPQEYRVTAAMRRALEAKVTDVVATLATHRGRSLAWPDRPPDVCDALGRGFLWRCHGGSTIPRE
ncbi:MAG: hypothetical protein V3T05_04765 [Myxococcota bacterium]